MNRVSRATVKAAEARAHAADEVADCAGLLLADAMVEASADVEMLARSYRARRADATWAWAVYADVIRQRTSVPA